MPTFATVFLITIVSFVSFTVGKNGFPKPKPGKDGLATTNTLELNQIMPEVRRTDKFNSKIYIKQAANLDITELK